MIHTKPGGSCTGARNRTAAPKRRSPAGKAILLALSLWGCDLPQEAENPEGLTVFCWNVQALFDGRETGNEYREYRGPAGWTEGKYLGRLTALSQAINGVEPGPDILALIEVESQEVLNDLAGKIYGQRRRETYFAANSGASLGTGIISRLPLMKTLVHSIYCEGETAPRPVMEVWINPGGPAMVLFVCHWKSKLGGAAATETLRRASARVILRRIREIRQSAPGTPALIMGDLNENYDEFYLQGAGAVYALMPDDPDAAARAGDQADFFVLTGNKPPEALHFPQSGAVFFTPWGETRGGSYYYKDNWETIDHFLLSGEFFDLSGWEYESCMVIDGAPFTGPRGYPAAYNPASGSGLSDHLPLLLRLRRQDFH